MLVALLVSSAVITTREGETFGCLTAGSFVVSVSGGSGLKVGSCSSPSLCLIMSQLFVAPPVATRALEAAVLAASIAYSQYCCFSVSRSRSSSEGISSRNLLSASNEPRPKSS